MCLAPTARHSPQSLGQRPRFREIKKTPPALKARFTSNTSSILLGWLRRVFSACCWSNQIPGARPQAEADKAPSALNRYSGRAFGVCTKCPPVCGRPGAVFFSQQLKAMRGRIAVEKHCPDTAGRRCEMQTWRCSVRCPQRIARPSALGSRVYRLRHLERVRRQLITDQ
jgi:hypothetical protein